MCHNVASLCDIIHELTQQNLNLATLQIMPTAIPARISSRISESESPSPQLGQHPTYNSTEDCKTTNDTPNGITPTLCGRMYDFLAGCPIRELLGVRCIKKVRPCCPPQNSSPVGILLAADACSRLEDEPDRRSNQSQPQHLRDKFSRSSILQLQGADNMLSPQDRTASKPFEKPHDMSLGLGWQRQW